MTFDSGQYLTLLITVLGSLVATVASMWKVIRSEGTQSRGINGMGTVKEDISKARGDIETIKENLAETRNDVRGMAKELNEVRDNMRDLARSYEDLRRYVDLAIRGRIPKLE